VLRSWSHLQLSRLCFGQQLAVPLRLKQLEEGQVAAQRKAWVLCRGHRLEWPLGRNKHPTLSTRVHTPLVPHAHAMSFNSVTRRT
jgi:hypothetical protein